MGVTIVRSSRAERDLVQIYRYIARESGSRRADAVVDRLERAIVLIADNPGIGRLRLDLVRTPKSFSVKPWIILYGVLPDDAGVFILRIVDGRRDLARL